MLNSKILSANYLGSSAVSQIQGSSLAWHEFNILEDSVNWKYILDIVLSSNIDY